MLRIESLEGAQLELSETNNNGIIKVLEINVSNCGDASAIKVSENITQNANLIACGSPDFDTAKGVFTINAATNNIANKLAQVFTASQVFKQSGDMGKTLTTIANYSSNIVGNIASLTATSQSSYEYQSALTEAISYKEAQVSGIDLDQELSQMIIFQQSYAACAQVFTASREILDILLGLV
jgi:flagellar hook-associated protein 1 FlgK